MQKQEIDPTILALLISTIGALLLKLRIKINRKNPKGEYQFWLDFQKQLKEDPQLLERVNYEVEKSKRKIESGKK